MEVCLLGLRNSALTASGGKYWLPSTTTVALLSAMIFPPHDAFAIFAPPVQRCFQATNRPTDEFVQTVGCIGRRDGFRRSEKKEINAAHRSRQTLGKLVFRAGQRQFATIMRHKTQGR